MAGGAKEGRAGSAKRAFVSGMLIRLLLSPVAAWLLLLMLNVHGTLFAVILVLSSMPAAECADYG
ncbi:hypothetical protein [Paenibacillus sp. CAA11]|uniref:hypothetical protein n=1 Tax=Paenibacillus sp. CAA11 TaxID=1532905 RepID=UPI003FA3B350